MCLLLGEIDGAGFFLKKDCHFSFSWVMAWLVGWVFDFGSDRSLRKITSWEGVLGKIRFDPKIVVNINFAVRERYQLDF